MRTINEIAVSGYITENEIRTICRRLNAGTMHIHELQPIWDKEEGVNITPEQAKKGYTWLMNQWKTPAGKERKNNPFGYREQEILENFSEIVLFGFYDFGRWYHRYAPLYYCGFEYYVQGGKINIVG